MSSVNKKFPKMDLLKLVYLRNLLWVSVCRETGSCTLFYRAFLLPFLSGLRIVTKSSSNGKSSPVSLWVTLYDIQLGQAPHHVTATGSLKG